jgi:hypothetical protein
VIGWGTEIGSASTGATGASIFAAAENWEANASLAATCWSSVGRFCFTSTVGSITKAAGSTNGCSIGS